MAVVELLERKGPLNDKELFQEARDLIGDLSFRELNKILMRLELNGIVRVTRLMKGKRNVELVQPAITKAA